MGFIHIKSKLFTTGRSICVSYQQVFRLCCDIMDDLDKLRWAEVSGGPLALLALLRDPLPQSACKQRIIQTIATRLLQGLDIPVSISNLGLRQKCPTSGYAHMTNHVTWPSRIQHTWIIMTHTNLVHVRAHFYFHIMLVKQYDYAHNVT